MDPHHQRSHSSTIYLMKILELLDRKSFIGNLQGIDSARGPEKNRLIYETTFRPVSADRDTALSTSAQHAQQQQDAPKQATMVVSAALQQQQQQRVKTCASGGGTASGWGAQPSALPVTSGSSARCSFFGRPCHTRAIGRPGLRSRRRGFPGQALGRQGFNSMQSGCTVLV